MNIFSGITSVSKDCRIPHTLDQLRPGQYAKIIAVEPSDLSDRMSDLGFTAGAVVRCELVSLLGDPVAFRILIGNSDVESCSGRAMIALRKSEARTVRLKDMGVESCATWD